MVEQKKRSTSKSKRRAPKSKARKRGFFARLRLWLIRLAIGIPALLLFWIVSFTVIDPPLTPYMFAERQRLGTLLYDWVDMDDVDPAMARSVVAAEDANFCLHWGFDMAAIRLALEEGANRGASTISQQTVKNVFLWHGRSWSRKALEAAMTPAVELFWSKRRIVEVYINVAEFDRGVFGVAAASRHYFGVEPGALTARQAALLASVLPAPKQRSASRPSNFVNKRATAITDGAATIRADGRAACFQD
ncbi:MAG: monofunctional biosynthetic peptidoglycan transglycosylase [Pseudomonadota bacterium]